VVLTETIVLFGIVVLSKFYIGYNYGFPLLLGCVTRVGRIKWISFNSSIRINCSGYITWLMYLFLIYSSTI